MKKNNKFLVYATKRTYLDGKAWWKTQIIGEGTNRIYGKYKLMRDAFWRGLYDCGAKDFSKVNWYHFGAVIQNGKVLITSNNRSKLTELYKSI